jgi:hypothetical protein
VPEVAEESADGYGRADARAARAGQRLPTHAADLAPIAPAGNFVSISFESDPTATVGLTLTVGANPLLLKHEDFGPALLGTVRAVSSVAGATVSYLEILDPSMHAR